MQLGMTVPLLTLAVTVLRHKSAVPSLTNTAVSGRTFQKSWHWNEKNVRMLMTAYVKTWVLQQQG